MHRSSGLSAWRAQREPRPHAPAPKRGPEAPARRRGDPWRRSSALDARDSLGRHTAGREGVRVASVTFGVQPEQPPEANAAPRVGQLDESIAANRHLEEPVRSASPGRARPARASAWVRRGRSKIRPAQGARWPPGPPPPRPGRDSDAERRAARCRSRGSGPGGEFRPARCPARRSVGGSAPRGTRPPGGPTSTSRRNQLSSATTTPFRARGTGFEQNERRAGSLRVIPRGIGIVARQPVERRAGDLGGDRCCVGESQSDPLRHGVRGASADRVVELRAEQRAPGVGQKRPVVAPRVPQGQCGERLRHPFQRQLRLGMQPLERRAGRVDALERPGIAVRPAKLAFQARQVIPIRRPRRRSTRPAARPGLRPQAPAPRADSRSRPTAGCAAWWSAPTNTATCGERARGSSSALAGPTRREVSRDRPEATRRPRSRPARDGEAGPRGHPARASGRDRPPPLARRRARARARHRRCRTRPRGRAISRGGRMRPASTARRVVGHSAPPRARPARRLRTSDSPEGISSSASTYQGPTCSRPAATSARTRCSIAGRTAR